MKSTAAILFQEIPANRGNIGHVVLNRPKKHNALTAEMLQQLYFHLQKWQQQKNIKAIIIEGSGDFAFSSGGDLKIIYNNRSQLEKSINFFRYEYLCNKIMFSYSKPVIALLDGITMGGGVGISFYGSHPVATERTIFAMPETAIGLYPDTGMGFILSRCPDYLGRYIALTGKQFSASDVYYLKFVSHIIDSNKQSALKNILINTAFNSKLEVDNIIENFSITVLPSKLPQYSTDIADCFSSSSIENIFKKLQEKKSPWHTDTLQKLQQASPTSLKVTFEQLQRARYMSFDAVIEMDFNLTKRFLQSRDLYIGIKSRLIDKSPYPQWQPNQLELVSSAMVAEYFKGTTLLQE